MDIKSSITLTSPIGLSTFIPLPLPFPRSSIDSLPPILLHAPTPQCMYIYLTYIIIHPLPSAPHIPNPHQPSPSLTTWQQPHRSHPISTVDIPHTFHCGQSTQACAPYVQHNPPPHLPRSTRPLYTSSSLLPPPSSLYRSLPNPHAGHVAPIERLSVGRRARRWVGEVNCKSNLCPARSLRLCVWVVVLASTCLGCHGAARPEVAMAMPMSMRCRWDALQRPQASSILWSINPSTTALNHPLNIDRCSALRASQRHVPSQPNQQGRATHNRLLTRVIRTPLWITCKHHTAVIPY